MLFIYRAPFQASLSKRLGGGEVDAAAHAAHDYLQPSPPQVTNLFLDTKIEDKSWTGVKLQASPVSKQRTFYLVRPYSRLDRQLYKHAPRPRLESLES